MIEHKAIQIQLADGTDILDYADPELICTIGEQKKSRDRWMESLADTPPPDANGA